MASRPTKAASRAGLRDSNKENTPSAARPRVSTGKDDTTKPTISPRSKDVESRTSPSLHRARAGTTSSSGKTTGGSVRSPRTSNTTSGSAHSPTTSTSTAPKLAKFNSPSATTKTVPTKKVATTLKTTSSPTGRSANALKATSATTSAAPRVMSAATRKALERRAQQSGDVEDSNDPSNRSTSTKPRKTPSPSKFFRIPSPPQTSNPTAAELASASEQETQAAIKQAQEDVLTAEERSRLLKSPLIERVGSFASLTAAGESPVMDPSKSQAEHETEPHGQSDNSTHGLAIDLGDNSVGADPPRLSPSEAKADDTLGSRPSTPLEKRELDLADNSLDVKEANTLALSPLPSPSKELRPTPLARSPHLRGGSTTVFQDVERQLVSVKAQFASTAAELKTQLNAKTTDLDREQRSLRELEQRFEKIMHQNIEVTQERDSLEREQAKFRETLEQCEDRIGELENSVAQLQKTNHTLETEKKDLTKSYTKASKDAAEKIEALQRMEAEVVELRGQLKELSAIPGGLAGLFEQIRILTEGYDNLNEYTSEINERWAALLMDRDICSGEVDRLRARLLDADRHVEAMKAQITQAVNDQDNIRAERDREVMVRQNNERHLNHLWYLMNSLRTEVKSKLDSNGAARLQELSEDQNQSAFEKESAFRDFREVEALVHQCSRLDATVKELEEQLSHSGQSSQDTETKVDELSTEVLKLKKQNEKLRENVETMWNLDESLQSVKDEIKTKTTELDAGKARILALESERQEYRNTIEILEGDKHTICKVHERELAKLLASHEKLRGESESLTSQIEESKILHQKLEDEKRSLADTYALEMQTVQEKYSKLQEHGDEIAHQLDENHTAHRKLLESFEALQKDHAELPSQIEKEVTSLLTERFDHERSSLMQAHVHEIRRLQESVDTLQDESSRLSKELDSANGMNHSNKFENEKQHLIERHADEVESLRGSLQSLRNENMELKSRLEQANAGLVQPSRTINDVIEANDSVAFARLANYEAIEIFKGSWKQAVLSIADANMISRLETITDRIPDEIMVFVINCGRDRLASYYSGRNTPLRDKLVEMIDQFCLGVVRHHVKRLEAIRPDGKNDISSRGEESTDVHGKDTLLNVVLREAARADRHEPEHSNGSLPLMEASDLELSKIYAHQFEAARALLAKVREYRQLSSALTTYDGSTEDSGPELTKVLVTNNIPPYVVDLMENHGMTLRHNEDFALLDQLQEQRVNTNLAFGKVSSMMDDLRQFNSNELESESTQTEAFAA